MKALTELEVAQLKHTEHQLQDTVAKLKTARKKGKHPTTIHVLMRIASHTAYAVGHQLEGMAYSYKERPGDE